MTKGVVENEQSLTKHNPSAEQEDRGESGVTESGMTGKTFDSRQDVLA